MESVYPWFTRAVKFHKQNNPLELEKLLLEQAYQLLQRLSARHSFDFEAVVFYVLKWNIVNRMVEYNSVAALKRFKELTRQGMENWHYQHFGATHG